MKSLFLSYSRKDLFFAELARTKLQAADISVWIDKGSLRAGDDWRQSIDQGIAESFAVLLALSEQSYSSPYVTYEWASAIGRGKTIIPVLLEPCSRHPRIEPIQYYDFSNAGYLPWKQLIKWIKKVRKDDEAPVVRQPENLTGPQTVERSRHDKAREQILEYLNRRGYQMVSNDRIRKRIDSDYNDEFIADLLRENSDVFREAKLKGDRIGLAKL